MSNYKQGYEEACKHIVAGYQVSKEKAIDGALPKEALPGYIQFMNDLINGIESGHIMQVGKEALEPKPETVEDLIIRPS